jgi:hypothetical protein
MLRLTRSGPTLSSEPLHFDIAKLQGLPIVGGPCGFHRGIASGGPCRERLGRFDERLAAPTQPNVRSITPKIMQRIEFIFYKGLTPPQGHRHLLHISPYPPDDETRKNTPKTCPKHCFTATCHSYRESMLQLMQASARLRTSSGFYPPMNS